MYPGVLLSIAYCFELSRAIFFVSPPIVSFMITGLSFCQFAAQVVQSEFAYISGPGRYQSIAFKFAIVIYYNITASKHHGLMPKVPLLLLRLLNSP